MSAYIVDPRTVDYLVSWATRHRAEHLNARTALVFVTRDEIPEHLRHAAEGADAYGWGLCIGRISPRDLGTLLMRANVRSVAYRYGDPGHERYYGEAHDMAAIPPDDLPGPVDQRRVWAYDFRPIPAGDLRPSWVLSCCRCLEYQSCEHPGWQSSPAHAVMTAIYHDAVSEIIRREGAPWGVTDADLNPAIGAGA